MNETLKVIVKHFLNYEFIYIFLFCSLIFLICSMFIKRKILKIIFIMLFAIFFALSGIEFILSLKMGPLQIANVLIDTKPLNLLSNDKNIKIKRSILFVDKDNINNKHWFEQLPNEKFLGNKIKVYDVQYSLYGNQFRYTKCNQKAEQAYVFFGCSFVAGDGLNDDQTLPYCFSKLMNFKSNVINCGLNGKSTNTPLNILNLDIIDNFFNKKQIKHFFYSFMSDQLFRNFRISITPENQPCDRWLYKDNKWIMPTQPFGKIKIIFARSYIFKKIFLYKIEQHNKKFYEDYLIESLKEMNKIIQEKYNSKLTILVWNDELRGFVWKLNNSGLDIIFIPQYYDEKNGYKIKYDGHPTAKANEDIANMLYKSYK